MRSITAIFLSWTLIASAQQVGQNVPPGPSQPPTFQASAQLVIETASVTDKNGKFIEGLTAKDFTITEDGKPQTISLFEYQKLSETPIDLPPTPSSEPIPLVKLTRTQIASERPGDLRYRDRRLLALYFDMSAMPPFDQLRAFDAAEKFIRTQMTAADLIAIMRYSEGSVQILNDFTDDRDKLLSTIQTLVVGEDQGFDETVSDASAADVGAAFGQNDSEFNLFNTDRQLSAIQTTSKMLGSLSEKKALIYFASGLKLNGVDNQAQLRATINAANRAGVQIWPVDARGLVAQAPLGDANRASPGGISMYNGASAMAFTNNFQRSQDTMYALAADTGGKALFDSNDLARGIVQAQKAFTSYYIMGYYTSNAALDGKFRRIKISLNGNLSYDVKGYREGYFAGKEFPKFTTADKERLLEDALMLGDPITQLTMAMEVDFFQLNTAEYFVPVTLKIPGSELALARRRGFEHTIIDFLGEIKDEYGSTITNKRDLVDVKLSDATAAELSKRPVEYDTGFTVLPGKYTVKFLAMDAETGRIGTYQTNFEIPDLNKENQRVAISSVVLSSQRVDPKDAIYTAKDKVPGTLAASPLVQEGQQLIPSVTRVFSKSRDMYIYLQAYEQGAETVRPLVAFVTFYRGQLKAFETPPLEVVETLNNRIKTMPLKFSFALDKLPPGEYTCQVTVLDPSDQKAAFWQAQVMLIP